MIPSPLILGGATPPGGLSLEVTAARGGLAGYQLLAVASGPPCAVEVRTGSGAWSAVTFPHTLTAGETLRLTRTDSSAVATIITALAPPDAGGEPLAVTADPDGYETITNAEATTDPDGYESVPDATATPDSDGYETVERSP